MIVTLTPNPSLDRTIELPELRRGAVLRATASRVDPGGKGVNVARALLANDVEALAVLPCGGAEGAQLAELLAAEGVKPVAVPIAAAVRVNVTVAEPDGTVTKLNELGPALRAQDARRLLDEVIDAAARVDASWIVGCGSLSPGTDDALYAQLVQRARSAGRRVAVDTSGAPLAAAVSAAPDLVKPNDEELAELVGRPLATLGDVIDAAEELRARGVASVLVSLGADGALLVDGEGAVLATPPAVPVASTVGAGDATLAGFLAATARGARGGAALAEAVTWGAAAVTLPGTGMPGPQDLQRLREHHGVRLERDLDRGIRLGSMPSGEKH